MSKSKGEALFIYQQDNGILLARAAQFTNPVRVTELTSIPTHNFDGNPYSTIVGLDNAKKGFVEAHVVVSNQGFQHLAHQPDSISKSKSTEYIPSIVKDWIGNDDDDFFFQVVNWETGEIVPMEDPQQKLMLISGMKTKQLRLLQERVLEEDFYPRKIECSVILMLGLILKLRTAGMIKTPMLLLEIYNESGLLIIIPAEGKPLIRTIDSGEKAMYEQIKNELSLKDTSSARKLMYSSTIDLSDIGQKVINPVFKEIASIIGLFEVETGQSISQIIVSNLTPNQHWVAELLAHDLGMEIPELNLSELSTLLEIQFEDGVEWDMKDTRLLPLLAAMGVL